MFAVREEFGIARVMFPAHYAVHVRRILPATVLCLLLLVHLMVQLVVAVVTAEATATVLVLAHAPALCPAHQSCSMDCTKPLLGVDCWSVCLSACLPALLLFLLASLALFVVRMSLPGGHFFPLLLTRRDSQSALRPAAAAASSMRCDCIAVRRRGAARGTSWLVDADGRKL